MFGILVYEHDWLCVGLAMLFILLFRQCNFLMGPNISLRHHRGDFRAPPCLLRLLNYLLGPTKKISRF